MNYCKLNDIHVHEFLRSEKRVYRMAWVEGEGQASRVEAKWKGKKGEADGGQKADKREKKVCNTDSYVYHYPKKREMKKRRGELFVVGTMAKRTQTQRFGLGYGAAKPANLSV